MYYHLYELNHAAMGPFRAAADATRLYFKNPLNPFSHTPFGRNVAAAAELFERTTRRYGKPEFGIASTTVHGERVPVVERVAWERPFCRLLHFEKMARGNGRPQPKLLIVAPMSGHYATLLRGTVETMLPDHDVYITDWTDARMVPLADGRFDLDDYIDYVISMLHLIGEGTNVMAVCQPSVPVLAAAAIMETRGDRHIPATMTLMGGPIDTRRNPTAVNTLANNHDLDWFRRHVIMPVPFPHPGFMREVYPGFLQISGFLSMNLDRHMEAHRDFFRHLVDGDGDSAEKHRDFYDEYLAVMDLSAEFYLQTVDTVFIRHALAERRDDASRRAGRSRRDPERRDVHRRGRERRHLRRRPDRGGARHLHRHPGGAAGALSPARPSVTTASSTARASAPKSRRASATSSRPSVGRRRAPATAMVPVRLQRPRRSPKRRRRRP